MIANKQANFIISNHQKNHINHRENQRQKQDNLKELDKENIAKLPVGNSNHNHSPSNNTNNRSKQSADQESNHLSKQLKQQNAIETTSEIPKTKTSATTQQTVMHSKRQHQHQSGTPIGGDSSYAGPSRRPTESSGSREAKLNTSGAAAVVVPASTAATDTTSTTTTSLTTTSAKIQQRQQKFLAAAAKSHLKRSGASGNANESAWRTPLLPLLARVNESRFSDKSPLNQAAVSTLAATPAAVAMPATGTTTSRPGPANRNANCSRSSIDHQHHQKQPSSTPDQKALMLAQDNNKQHHQLQRPSNNLESPVGCGGERMAATCEGGGAGCDLQLQQQKEQTLPSSSSKLLSPRAGASISAPAPPPPSVTPIASSGGCDANRRRIVSESSGDGVGVVEGDSGSASDKMRVSASTLEDSSAPVAFQQHPQRKTTPVLSQSSGDHSRVEFPSTLSDESDLQRRQQKQPQPQQHNHNHQQQHPGVRKAGEKDKPVRKDANIQVQINNNNNNNNNSQSSLTSSPSPVDQQKTSQQPSSNINSGNNLLASSADLIQANQSQEQQHQLQIQRVDNETNSDSNYFSSTDKNNKTRNLNNSAHQPKTNAKPTSTSATINKSLQHNNKQLDNIQHSPYQTTNHIHHSTDNTCAKSINSIINKPSTLTSTTPTTKHQQQNYHHHHHQQQRQVHLISPKQPTTTPNVNKNTDENQVAISNQVNRDNKAKTNHRSIAGCGPSSTGGGSNLNQQQSSPSSFNQPNPQGTSHQRQQFYNNINILCSNHTNNNTNIINSANQYHQYNNHHQINYQQQVQQQQQQQHHQHQHQHQQPHQNVMAHYKFHNDCQSSVLTYEQVKRLDFVMDQTVPIHGRGNSPTLFVKLKELIRLVKYKLQHEHSIDIRDVRLNGGAASYVLAPENSHYNDLDLIFGTDLSDEDRFDVIRDVVLECVMEFAPDRISSRRQQQSTSFTTCTTNNTDTSLETGEGGGYNNDEINGTDDDDLTELSRSNRSLSLESDSMKTFTLANNGSSTSTSTSSSSRDDDDDDEGASNCDENNKLSANEQVDSDFKTISDQQHDANKNPEWLTQESAPVGDDKLVSGQDASPFALATTRASGAPSGASQPYVMTNSKVNGLIDPVQQNQHNIASYQMPLSNCAIKEAYVHKMVKVNDDDRWSLISLGVQQSEANCCNQQQVQEQHRLLLIQQQQELGGASGVQMLQSPNSIELKFVDRMRRKFEFSVDSFQIILDSLIQFYDYVPQSTITIQKKLATGSSSHPSSIIYGPMLSGTSRRRSCCCPLELRRDSRFDCKSDNEGDDDGDADDDNNNGDQNQDQDNDNLQDHETYEKNDNNTQQDYQDMSNFLEAGHQGKSGNKNRRHSNNTTTTHHHHHRCSQSYFQLPTSSPSNSSVASSSGCSSSSSVVSSSSSSLSYDEDQEDLYGDADSTPSSSASTSSLLGSTTLSMMSSASSSSAASPSSVSAMKSSTSTSSQAVEMKQKHLHQKLSKGQPVAVVAATSGEAALTHTCACCCCCCSTSNSSANNATRNTSKITLANVVVPLADCSDQHQFKTVKHGKHCKQSSAGGVSLLEATKQQNALISNNNKNLCDFETSVKAMKTLSLSKTPPPPPPTTSSSSSSSSSSSCAVISENFYPTVIGRSEYGNFKEAMYHLEKKLIATRSPEEIRGGGLLKYCNLLVKNYKPTNVYQIRTLERYMCSRFFIDFSDLNQQRAKLESYLANHFSDDPIQKFDYLTILHNVVQRSTVCLMNHELKLTLSMIRELAYKLNEQQLEMDQHQQQNMQPLQPANKQQQQQHYYQQQEPIMMQSGIYRVKLVNYALTKPVKS